MLFCLGYFLVTNSLVTNKIERILGDIEHQGWSIQTDFFPTDLTVKLRETLIEQHQQGKLKQAGIGRESKLHIETSIRSDQINWFDENRLNLSQAAYLTSLNQLKDALNQQFYFGLIDFEVHFALYETNAFYKRHLDQHQNQDTRVLTTITYLNENWQDEDGGELCVYVAENKTITVKPETGTLVCFLSAEYEHEVLPAKRERASLTGWFRRRD